MLPPATDNCDVLRRDSEGVLRAIQSRWANLAASDVLAMLIIRPGSHALA
jgi:hypothetical protein